jgi:hypothetical protein
MSAEPADPSLAPSLVDDVALRLQRQVGLVPARGLGVVRRAVFFALLTWLPLVAWALYTGGYCRAASTSRWSCTSACTSASCWPFRRSSWASHGAPGEHDAHSLLPDFRVVPPAQRGPSFAWSEASPACATGAPWVLIAVVVVAWTILQPVAVGSEAEHEAKWASSGEAGGLGFGGWWFLYVSRPIFSVLLIAWLWRLALVFVLLKRIARLDLSIVPTHPDGAGGLGFLKDMPKAFSLLAFATSAVVASRLAHDVMYHDVSLLSLKVVLGGFVLLVVVICIAPLLALAGPLAAAKRRGLLEYGALVGEHGRLVRRRWILGEAPADDALLQAPEIGPVADTLAPLRRGPPDAGRALREVHADRHRGPDADPILVLLSTQVPIKEVLKKIVGVFF